MQRMDSRNYWQWLNKLELNNAPDTDLPVRSAASSSRWTPFR